MSPGEILRRRLAAQHLSPGTEAGGAIDAAAQVCGIQAQDVRASLLALRARVPGLTRAAILEERELVRTWTWRGTVHLFPRADWPWIHALCAPRFAPYYERLLAKRGNLEIAQGMVEDAVALLREEPMTRAELLPLLYERGHASLGELSPNVLMPYFAIQGPILGLPDGRFVATDPPPPVDEDEALATLARRYLAGYAPAAAEDLAAWSGLALGKARRGLELAGEAPALAEPVEPRAVQLLPMFDTLTLGWKSREFFVAGELAKRVLPGGGIIKAVVLVRGRAAGTWKLGGSGKRRTLEVDWFGKPQPARALAAEAADVGRFLGVDVVSAA